VPTGYATPDEKTWVLLAHFGAIAGILIGGGIFGWLPPLIAMLTKGNESPTVRAHAVEALNHQLTWAIAFLAVTILGICGSLIIIGVFLFFLLPFIALVPLVFAIIAGVKANNGEFYRYPATVRMVK